MLRLVLTLACVVLLGAGCGSQEEASGDAAALQPPPDSLLVYPGEVVLTRPDSVTNVETRSATLESVVPTDDGCFVMVEADGEQELLMATREACAMARPLEGQEVSLEQGESDVEAEGCVGPGCPEGGTTRLVVGVLPVE